MSRLANDLAVAHSIIDHVDELTLARFGASDLRVETKPDLTPVSDADREAEAIVRRMLASARPEDAIYGEEQGGDLAPAGRRWIVDPIDGTKNYVRGVPVWATLLGLEEDGEMVLGVVSAPALGRRWWAAKGLGAHMAAPGKAARQIRASAVNRLEDASLSYSSLTGWAERGQLEAFLKLGEACWRTRAYGDFWSYMMVAEGAVDLAGEPELELYDMAALVPIVEEAGGRFTSLEGEPGPWGANGFASNGLLHEAALAMLARGE